MYVGEQSQIADYMHMRDVSSALQRGAYDEMDDSDLLNIPDQTNSEERGKKRLYIRTSWRTRSFVHCQTDYFAFCEIYKSITQEDDDCENILSVKGVVLHDTYARCDLCDYVLKSEKDGKNCTKISREAVLLMLLSRTVLVTVCDLHCGRCG